MSDTETMMTPSDEANEQADMQSAAEPSNVRGRWSREGSVAIRTNADGTSLEFDMAALPFNVVDHLAYRGLAFALSHTENPNETFAALARGEIKVARAASEKEPKISDWRLAIANAMVEATKKAEVPLTLADAKAKALALTTEQVRPAKTDALVVKHYNKLKGAGVGGLSALLAA